MSKLYIPIIRSIGGTPLGECARTLGAILHFLPNKANIDYFGGLDALAAISGLSIGATRKHLAELNELGIVTNLGKGGRTPGRRKRNRGTYRLILSKETLQSQYIGDGDGPAHFRFPLELADKVPSWTQCLVVSLIAWRCNETTSCILADKSHGLGVAYIAAMTGLDERNARYALRQLVKNGVVSFDRKTGEAKLMTNKYRTTQEESRPTKDATPTNKGRTSDQQVADVRPTKDAHIQRLTISETNHTEAKHNQTNHPTGSGSASAGEGEGLGVVSADTAKPEPPPPRTDGTESTFPEETELSSAAQAFIDEAPQFVDLLKLSDGMLEIVIAVWLGCQSRKVDDALLCKIARDSLRTHVESANAVPASKVTRGRDSILLGILRNKHRGIGELLVSGSAIRKKSKALCREVEKLIQPIVTETRESEMKMKERTKTCNRCGDNVEILSDQQRDHYGRPLCGSCRANICGSGSEYLRYEGEVYAAAMLYRLDSGGNTYDWEPTPEHLEILAAHRRGELAWPHGTISYSRYKLDEHVERAANTF